MAGFLDLDGLLLVIYVSRLLPGGAIPGASGDGAAAVRRAAAAPPAQLPRRLVCLLSFHSSTSLESSTFAAPFAFPRN